MSTESDDSFIPQPEEDMAVQPNVHMLLKIVILGVIGFVSAVGNLIAFGAVLINPKLRRMPLFIFIAGLALADVIVTVMFVPAKIINHLDKGEVTSNAWCKVYGFLYNSCQYISAFYLVILAVLRAMLLTDRSQHKHKTLTANLISVGVWLLALLPNISIIDSSVLDELTQQCVIVFGNKDDYLGAEQDNSSAELYTLLSAVISYFLPLFVMFVVYIVAGYMSKRFFEDSYSPRDRRLSKMITYLILCFTFCRLPYEMVNLLFYYQTKNANFYEVLEDPEKYKVWIHVIQYLQVLAMLDQAFRPLIYATMSREFGKMYDQIINCTYCKEEEDEVLPARLRRRGQDIEEVLHTPLTHPTEIEIKIETEETLETEPIEIT